MTRWAVSIILALTLLAGPGCSSKNGELPDMANNPAGLSYAGFLDLAQDNRAQARLHFKQALQAVPGYGPALAGYAALNALEGEPLKARRFLQLAYSNAPSSVEQAFAALAELIMIRALADPFGLRLGAGLVAQHKFELQLRPMLHYELARLYMLHCKYAAAQKEFGQAAALDWKLQETAVQQGLRAGELAASQPAGKLGCQIMSQARLSRADLAALLVDELNLPAFLGVSRLAPLPADLVNHPLRREIRSVLALELKGLQLMPDGGFAPGEVVSRAGLAEVLQSVLISISGDKGLAASFAGQKSPFNDLPAEDGAFNAVMLAIQRGLMQPLSPNRFGPEKPASGAQAMAAVGKLRGSD